MTSVYVQCSFHCRMCWCKRISLECHTNYLVVYMSTPHNLDSPQNIPLKPNKGIDFFFFVLDNLTFPSVSVDVSVPTLTAILGCFHRCSSTLMGWKETQWKRFGSLCKLVAHFNWENIINLLPLRTQHDCIFPLSMVTSPILWVQIPFHLACSIGL